MFDPSTLKALIREHGVVVALRKRTASAFDVHTGTVGQSTADYLVRGYFFTQKYSDSTNNQIKNVKSLVLDNVLTSGVDTPNVDATDYVIYNGNYAVVKAEKITSGTKTMCYILEVDG